MNDIVRPPAPSRIAVVGSGIAGLAAAWLLSTRHQVVLYEAAGRLGGHTNTVDVSVAGAQFAVDTGFLVFNHRTYPNLTGLFDHLGVASVASEMSFSVSLTEPELEWAGSSLATVFGQRRNLVRPAFWGMLSDILRFNRDSQIWLDRLERGEIADAGLTLRDFLDLHGFRRSFADWYLLPMAAAIWSCPTCEMLDYPLATFVRFCRNHGLLQIFDRPEWRTVEGGARRYVERLRAGIGDVRLDDPVQAVIRGREHVMLSSAAGVDTFDHVVFACHSDQALRILGNAATPDERTLLARVRYQPNRAVLHTDPQQLPRNRKLWSAWNYLGGKDAGAGRPVAVSYLINRLQPLPVSTPVVVTLNPTQAPRPEHVLAEFDYAHPVFDLAAISAQLLLPTIQGRQRLWYCGAWTGYGFHEDGLKSALAVAAAFGIAPPWQIAASPTVEHTALPVAAGEV